MAKCSACGKFLKGGVVCPLCQSQSHNECVRIPVGTKVSETWRCGECQVKAPKGRDPSTPVRGMQDVVSQETKQVGLLTESVMVRDDTAHRTVAESTEELGMLRDSTTPDSCAMQRSILAELRDFKADFCALSSEMREFRVEMAELRVSLAGITARLDGFERRLEVVEQQRAQAAPDGAVAELERTVERLKGELNDRDQEALLSDLEIGHLPEAKGESVLHAVSVLAAKLGVPLEDRDIVFAERVGVQQLATATGEAPRARRVVVRLARRHLRDQLLQAARVRRTLTDTDAGGAQAAPPRRIFVNERLTGANRLLFFRVREECRKVQWKYAWTKRGRVYARRGDGEQAYPIRSEVDMKRVFGSNLV